MISNGFLRRATSEDVDRMMYFIRKDAILKYGTLKEKYDFLCESDERKKQGIKLCQQKYKEDDTNKQKLLDYHRQYQKKNREKVNAYVKKYRDNNKEKEKERNRKYREENKDKMREYRKEWYRKKLEKMTEEEKKEINDRRNQKMKEKRRQKKR